MTKRPTVLNFSGNDSAGMAGLTMDLRVQHALGLHSASVITANTAQNNQQVISLNPVSADVFKEQLIAVKDLPIKAIKVGLLQNFFQIDTIAKYKQATSLPLVIDPVLASTSGKELISIESLKHFVKTLLPLCEVLTPNIAEAELLSGIKIHTADDIILAASKLLSSGLKAIYIKGGHFDSGQVVKDYFTDGKRSFWLNSNKVNTNNTRGTGCALASAIASSLALGYSVYDAAVIAKMTVNQGLRQSYAVDEKGPICVTHFPNEQCDLPILSNKANTDASLDRSAFPAIEKNIGLYPVIDRAAWIEKLAPTGIKIIQLRVKDLDGYALENEIKSAIALAEKYHCCLFINDYWQLAIKHKAYGVHLGQEDLDDADIDEIHKAGLRLGTSTHCHYEVARAHLYKPSYIACGPVYHTTTKDMPWVPHGIEGLQYWRDTLDYPLVAIGGINKERIPLVAQTKVDSIAMITAITLADDPVATTKNFIQLARGQV